MWQEQSTAQKIRTRPTICIFQQTKRFGSCRRDTRCAHEVASQPSEPGHGGQRAKTTPPPGHVHEAWIASEKLITTEARDCDFEARFPSSFRHEPGIDPVDRRLI